MRKNVNCFLQPGVVAMNPYVVLWGQGAAEEQGLCLQLPPQREDKANGTPDKPPVPGRMGGCSSTVTSNSKMSRVSQGCTRRLQGAQMCLHVGLLVTLLQAPEWFSVPCPSLQPWQEQPLAGDSCTGSVSLMGAVVSFYCD